MQINIKLLDTKEILVNVGTEEQPLMATNKYGEFCMVIAEVTLMNEGKEPKRKLFEGKQVTTKELSAEHFKEVLDMIADEIKIYNTTSHVSSI